MQIFKSFKLYKTTIYNNNFFILLWVALFTFVIVLESFISSKQANISELQLTYNNLSLFRQSLLYIPFSTVITMKILEFIDNPFIIMRLESKDRIWNQAITHILITNVILSFYLVTFTYITGLLFTQQRYMTFGKTLILITALILLYTVGLSLFALIALIIKLITGNKVIAYMVILAIMVPENLKQEDSLILSKLSFSMDYLSNYRLAFLNILKFGGIIILMFELGRVIYKKTEVYNTKKLIMSDDYYED